MRSLDPALNEHLIETVTTLATCWRITRVDGVQVGFTSHDTDLQFAGILFKSTGISQTDTSSSMGLEVDTVELHGLLEDDEGTPEQVLSKLYDRAQVDAFEVNYKAPPSAITRSSVIWIKSGIIGDIIRDSGAWIAEARALTDLLRQSSSVKTSRLCRAEFGGPNCRADLSLYQKSGEVTGQSGRILTTNLSGVPDGALEHGLVELSNGVKFDVQSNSGGTVTLTEQPEFDAVGLAVVATYGCNKWLDDCASYNNIANFYGEPYVPDADDWAAGFFNTVSL